MFIIYYIINEFWKLKRNNPFLLIFMEIKEYKKKSNKILPTLLLLNNNIIKLKLLFIAVYILLNNKE